MKITLNDLESFATGAAFLGTGGGGDPYLGKLFIRNAMEDAGAPDIIHPDQLKDDEFVVSVAMMGAPSVLFEKMLSMEDMHLAVSQLEEHIGKRATAIIPAEVGGINATLPVAYAAWRRLPVVDADGMGRCFPALEMTTFNVEGVAATPMVLANEHGEWGILSTNSALSAEQTARPIVAHWGGSAMISLYPMTGTEARKTAVAETLSLSLGIGDAILKPPVGTDPVEALLAFLRSTKYYCECRTLFDGKITDLVRKTERGWNIGYCHLEALDDPDTKMEVVFQNEFLVARENGRMVTIVPDLISIVDRETAIPITTESLRYGQRVKVIGASAAPVMRSEKALEVFGPKAFGLDEAYVPIEKLETTTRSGGNI